jgi:hypothetical protein
MGVRTEELAKKFEESCREFANAVEGLSDADWKKVTAAEKWPVGASPITWRVGTRGSPACSRCSPRTSPCPS